MNRLHENTLNFKMRHADCIVDVWKSALFKNKKVQMKRSDSEIDEILDSFGSISRAEAKPFMHTRIMAKLEEENTFWANSVRFFAKPVIAFACLTAVIAANIYIITNADVDDDVDDTTSSVNIVSEVLQNDNYILAANDID